MGFMDKAKKMAQQAQEKLDEVQKNFNESQAAKTGDAAEGGAGPVTEYDKHGRPVGDSTPPPPPATPVTPAEGVSAAGAPPAGEAAAVVEAFEGAPVEAATPVAEAPKPPTAPSEPSAAPGQDQDDTPPKMSSGDPLAG